MDAARGCRPPRRPCSHGSGEAGGSARCPIGGACCSSCRGGTPRRSARGRNPTDSTSLPRPLAVRRGCSLIPASTYRPRRGRWTALGSPHLPRSERGTCAHFEPSRIPRLRKATRTSPPRDRAPWVRAQPRAWSPAMSPRGERRSIPRNRSHCRCSCTRTTPAPANLPRVVSQRSQPHPGGLWNSR
jgi:hypothetical protein